MKIEIYARSPDQEFTDGPTPLSAWKNAPYSSGPGVFYQRWDKLQQSIQMDRPLRDFVNLRRDEPSHGFVHNLWKNLVFFADGEAMDLLSSLADQPLSQIQKTQPWILEKLHLK